MELNGWTSPQMLTRYGASARSARARRSYDRIMDDSTLPGPTASRSAPGQSKTLPEARRRPSDPDHDHHQSHPPRSIESPAHSAYRLLSVKETAV